MEAAEEDICSLDGAAYGAEDFCHGGLKDGRRLAQLTWYKLSALEVCALVNIGVRKIEHLGNALCLRACTGSSNVE